MSAMLPMAIYGLEVPPGDVPISGRDTIQSAFRITMAAIDPSAEAEGEEGAIPRATLKIIRTAQFDEEDYDSDEFDADEFERQMLDGASDDEDDDDDDEAGPSDKTARKAAAKEAIMKLLSQKDDMDVDSDEDDDEIPNGVNGTKKSAKALGKLPAGDDDEDEDEDEDDEEDIDAEEFVLCTLDPTKNFQQPLDITVGEDERVLFKVSGTHSIFLTGNYVIPAVDDQGEYDSDEDDEEGYDLEPDSDELDEEFDEDEEEDELDDLATPRITDITTLEQEDDDEAPTLVKTKVVEKKADKKGKNKRAAEEDPSLDEIIAATSAKESAVDEPKLSKAQRKKLKKNDGTSAETPKAESDPPSASKKVEFAKNLVQGPTASKNTAKKPDTTAGAQSDDKSKAALGVKIVQGVTIDDKKLGTGPAAKKGDKVGMRYIGKLQNGKVFDSNKKGKPFSFKLGAGDVIKGWDIGVAGMSAGGERRITIPANLGYGAAGAKPDIPGGATLVFDVKMMEIQGGKK